MDEEERVLELAEALPDRWHWHDLSLGAAAVVGSDKFCPRSDCDLATPVYVIPKDRLDPAINDALEFLDAVRVNPDSS